MVDFGSSAWTLNLGVLSKMCFQPADSNQRNNRKSESWVMREIQVTWHNSKSGHYFDTSGPKLDCNGNFSPPWLKNYHLPGKHHKKIIKFRSQPEFVAIDEATKFNLVGFFHFYIFLFFFADFE